jgi:hypothetical protein
MTSGWFAAFAIGVAWAFAWYLCARAIGASRRLGGAERVPAAEAKV